MQSETGAEFHQLPTLKKFFVAWTDKPVFKRAIKVASVVGTILTAINQGDAIIAGQMPVIWKVILTYCVPYCVASYSAAAMRVEQSKKWLAAQAEKQAAEAA